MLAVTVKPLQADFGELGAMLAAATALLVFVYVLARQHGVAARHDDTQTLKRHSRQRVASLAVGMVGIAILIAVPRFVSAIETSEPSSLDPEAFQPILDCVAAGPRRSPWKPRFDSPAVEWAVSFDCDGQVVNVYIAAYSSALQGAELISSAHYVVPPSWDRFVMDREKVTADGAEALELFLSRPGYESVVRYWYSVDGNTTASQTKAKLLQILALLGRDPAGGAVYALEAPVSGDAATATQELRRVSKILTGTNPFESMDGPR